MADNVTGIVLDIPADVLQNIKNADKAIKQLEATSKHAANTIKGHFDNTMVSGVNAFIKKVNEAQNKLGSLNINVNIKDSGFSSLSQIVSQSLGGMSQLVQQLSQIAPNANLAANGLGKISDEIKKAFPYEAGKNIDQLSTAIDNINKKLRDNKGGVTPRADEQYLVNLRARYQEELKILNQSDQKRQEIADKEAQRKQRELERNSEIGRKRNEQYHKDVEAEKMLDMQRRKAFDAYDAQERKRFEQQQQQAQRRNEQYHKEIENEKLLNNARQKRVDQAGKSYDNAVLSEQNKLLNERLKIQKQLGNLAAVEAKNTILGNKPLTADQMGLKSDLLTRIREIDNQLTTLGAKYDFLGEKARKAFDTRNVQGYLAWQQETIKNEENIAKARAKANELITTQAKAGLQPTTEELSVQRQLAALYTQKLGIEKEIQQVNNQITLQGRGANAAQQQYLTYLNNQTRALSGEISTVARGYTKIEQAANNKYMAEWLRMQERAAYDLAQAQEQVNKTRQRDDVAKKLSEYKALVAENERLSKAMRDYVKTAGSAPAITDTSASAQAYRNMEAQWQANEARRRQISAQNITEIAEFERQMQLKAYQDNVNAFIQAEAQKKNAAIQRINEESAARKAAYDKYTSTYEGAVKYAAKDTRTDTYEKREIAIKKVEAAIKNLSTTDSDYANKLQRLTTILNTLKNAQKAVTDEMNKKPAPTSADAFQAIAAAKAAKSLSEYQKALEKVKTVMSTMNVNDPQWAALNKEYLTLKNRIDEIRKKMGEFKSTASGVGDIAGQLARTLAATFSVSAITGYINKMIQVRAQFELQQTALRAILQDKDEADRIFMQVQQLALQSPFSIMQMTNYTKQLAAYRIESEKLVGTTKMLADVSAGLGVDMGRLILAYGQVKAANYLRACLGKGTKVKMFDGSYKNVEDVVVGDVLMGDDEQPRHVSKLYQGEQQMYRISYKGGSFRCNEHHILTVYDALCDCISDVFVTEVFNSPLVYRYQGVRRVDGKYEPFFMDVEKDTVDTYYGFSIDGNHRFIIEDNVVTHNTEVRQFTEAGLNIAGELATYFSELQGKMVSVGDVMDMITKRMVRFEDVEEVFKRVTSAGGLFYDMQKKQSETLWGQLQRIKDAMSIMFNEIGKSNQTAISGALTIIRSLLANWRIFANLLTGASLAFAAYTVKTIAAAVATNTFNASQKGLVGALARSKAALLAFTKFLSANPYILAITGVVALGSALLDWKQKVDSAREAYDNMIVGISERESKLTAIADKVADTNKRITESQQAMKKSKVGTDEYTNAVDANKQAMLEQNRALQELRNNFPEVYRQMVQTKDGVVDLTEGIKAFTESASQQRVITTLQSDNAGWTNDDLKEDLEELAQSQAKYDAAIMSATASSEALFAKVQAIYETEKATGNVSEDISKFYKGLLDLKDQELSKEERLRKIVGLRNQMSVDGMLKLDKAYSDFYEKYQKTINTGGWTNIKGSLEKDTAEATKEIDKLLNNVLTSAGVTSVQMFEGLKDGTKQSTAIALNGFIKDLGLSLDEAQRKLLEANLFAPLKITPFWEMSALPQQMSFLQGKINAYIEEHNIGSIVADIQVSDNTDSYFNGIITQWKAANKEIEQLENATTQIAEDGNKQRIAQLQAEQAERAKFFKTFGINYLGNTKTTGRQKDIWTPRLNLMQKVNKEYEKLLKYYSQEEAMAKMRTSYGDAVAEAFKGTQWADISKWGTFDAQATVDRLKKLAEVAGKDAKKKILEAVGTLQAELEIKVKEQEIQQAKDEIQKAFDSYELTKTLGNLGLNVDLTYMVGGQPMTLPQIRKDIEDKLKVAKATDGQEELVKTYEDYLRKVSDMENKAAVERLKNYNKYLLESMSERVRIEMETAQLINKIRQDETLDAETKTMAIQRAKQEEQKKLSQQAWKDFQSTDVYISLFEDVQRASSQSIDFVLNKLHSLRDSLKNLPADQVRAIVKQIESLEQEQVQRNPFKALKDNLGGVISNMREYARLEKEHLANTEKLAGATAFRDDTQKRVALLSEQLNAEKARTDITKDEKAEHDKIIQALERELAVHKGILKAQNMQVEGLTESVTESGAKLNILKAQFKSVGTGLQSIGDYAKELGNTIGNVASSLENVFGTMSDGTADTISSIQEILGGVGDLAGGVGRIVSGDTIGGVMQAVTGLASTIGSVFAIGDKKKERQIQRLQDKVEDLQKAYKKLGTAIEEAYSFDDYNMAYEQSLSNLEQQRRAIEEQMALEEAKKKTDKDKLKEYEDALEQIAEEEKLVRNQFYQDWGSYSTDQLKSASEDFASAWYEAFKETGDGLDALNEKWDDYFENLILKQIASAVTQKRLSKYVDDINALLDQKDLSEAERAKRMKEIWDRAQNESSVLDNELQNLMEYLGIKGGQGDLLLSDLQKGIQNITEPQAAAIEAYLNSMRFAVFEQNNILTDMLTAIQAQYGTSTDNPILSEVKAIRSLVASIDERLGRVIVSRNSGANNYIMKVG